MGTSDYGDFVGRQVTRLSYHSYMRFVQFICRCLSCLGNPAFCFRYILSLTARVSPTGVSRQMPSSALSYKLPRTWQSLTTFRSDGAGSFAYWIIPCPTEHGGLMVSVRDHISLPLSLPCLMETRNAGSSHFLAPGRCNVA